MASSCRGVLVLLSVLAVASGPASAQDKKPRRPRDNGEAPPPHVVPGEKVSVALMDLGEKKLQAGDYRGALDAFARAQKEAPRDPRPIYLRGEVYQKMDRPREAEADFRRALELDPRLYDVRAELGAVLSDQGNAAAAEEVLKQAVAERPDHFESWYNLGVARDALAHWADAAEAYGRAAKLRPRDPDTRFNLSVALRRAGRPEQALPEAREAVKLAPDDAQAHLNLGLMLSDLKRLDDSVVELQAATKLKPDLQKAWWRLGVVQLKRNQPREAILALERARALKATPEVLTDLGLARRSQGDLAAAEAIFKSALQLDGKYQPARIHLAYTLAARDPKLHCQDALKELAAVPNDPRYAESMNRVRSLCQYKGK